MPRPTEVWARENRLGKKYFWWCLWVVLRVLMRAVLSTVEAFSVHASEGLARACLDEEAS